MSPLFPPKGKSIGTGSRGEGCGRRVQGARTPTCLERPSAPACLETYLEPTNPLPPALAVYTAHVLRLLSLSLSLSPHLLRLPRCGPAQSTHKVIRLPEFARTRVIWFQITPRELGEARLRDREKERFDNTCLDVLVTFSVLLLSRVEVFCWFQKFASWDLEFLET